MNKKVKAMLLVLCALILVVGSVMGTFAYLTDTKEVVNTFTVGSVKITLDEAKVDEYGNLLYKTDVADEFALTGTELADRVNGNTYKLIPGHVYNKDPKVTVVTGSEDSYIFVKIENGLGADATIAINSGWEKVDGKEDVWVYGTNADPVSISAGNSVTPFTTFTFGAQADPAECTGKTIKVTAYAIQTDGFGNKTAQEVFAELTPDSNT